MELARTDCVAVVPTAAVTRRFERWWGKRASSSMGWRVNMRPDAPMVLAVTLSSKKLGGSYPQEGGMPGLLVSGGGDGMTFRARKPFHGR